MSPVNVAGIAEGDLRAYDDAWLRGYNAGGAGRPGQFAAAWGRLVA